MEAIWKIKVLTNRVWEKKTEIYLQMGPEQHFELWISEIRATWRGRWRSRSEEQVKRMPFGSWNSSSTICVSLLSISIGFKSITDRNIEDRTSRRYCYDRLTTIYGNECETVVLPDLDFLVSFKDTDASWHKKEKGYNRKRHIGLMSVHVDSFLLLTFQNNSNWKSFLKIWDIKKIYIPIVKLWADSPFEHQWWLILFLFLKIRYLIFYHKQQIRKLIIF